MVMVRQTHTRDENGFAALIIAITLVIVTSLLVVGFAQLARNEQNQVTNRQLSNQAYYAAETGVNDAVAAISGGYVTAKTTCGPLPTSGTPGANYLTNNNVDQTPPGTTAATQWTCLLIDPAPTTVEYGSVSTVTPTLFTFTGATLNGTSYTNTNVNSLNISWQDADPSMTSYKSDNGAANSSFPVASGPGGWNATGMLRVTITPLGNPITRDGLRSSSFTAFLYPTTVASTTANYDVSSTGNGPILNGGCNSANTPRACKVTINTSALNTPGPFLVSLRSIYSKTNVSIAINGGTGDRIAGAQSKIDSTGRAQNVLKRLQVRVPTKNSYTSPGFSVETTGDICKQLNVYPGAASGCGY